MAHLKEIKKEITTLIIIHENLGINYIKEMKELIDNYNRKYGMLTKKLYEEIKNLDNIKNKIKCGKFFNAEFLNFSLILSNDKIKEIKHKIQNETNNLALDKNKIKNEYINLKTSNKDKYMILKMQYLKLKDDKILLNIETIPTETTHKVTFNV